MCTVTMMVAFRNPLGPPLLLSIILLILPSFVVPSISFNNTNTFKGDDTEDYNNLDYETTPSPSTNPVHPMVERCKYDLCRDQQPSCQQLAITMGCSCPGMSGLHELPAAPHLRRLSRDGSGRVVVHWCAPASMVSHYLVQVAGQKEERLANESRRQMDLGKLEVGTEVCVLAVNMAGTSAKEKHSCAQFQLDTSESSLALRLGLIGGVVALLVVLALALLLWRLRRRRKTLARTDAGGAEGVL
ncbi:hypothetical protein NFI96_034003 [Prochilodus magdalenae]|nr:hypothetical protein NFI96_034003 [Prochilodus magdalenae]